MKKTPYLIIIDGPMGSGKSTTAKSLHKKLPHSALITLDFVRRIISGFDLDNKEHHRIASDMLDKMIAGYIKEGYTTIIERSITSERDVARIEKLLGKKVKTLFYRIEAPLEVRIKRVKERKIPNHLKKGSTVKRVKRNNYYYQELKHNREMKVFDSTKLSTVQIVNKILRDIK